MRFYKFHCNNLMCIKEEITEDQFERLKKEIRKKARGNITYFDIDNVRVYVLPPLNCAFLARTMHD